MVRPPGQARLTGGVDRDVRHGHADPASHDSEPFPRVIGYRASQPCRSSRRAWLLAATSLHPIAHRHASNGAGPSLDSHRSPSIVAGPGRNTRVISTLQRSDYVRDQSTSAPAAHRPPEPSIPYQHGWRRVWCFAARNRSGNTLCNTAGGAPQSARTWYGNTSSPKFGRGDQRMPARVEALSSVEAMCSHESRGGGAGRCIRGPAERMRSRRSRPRSGRWRSAGAQLLTGCARGLNAARSTCGHRRATPSAGPCSPTGGPLPG